MRGEYRLLHRPHIGKAAVPNVQPPILSKHRDRFIQIIKRRGADAQQCVARAGQLDLFGPVLKQHEEAAIGHG
jgi:hypothetical protein